MASTSLFVGTFTGANYGNHCDEKTTFVQNISIHHLAGFEGPLIVFTFAPQICTMIYLLATTILSASIFVIFKLFKRYHIDNLQAIVVNYLVAFVVGYFAYAGQAAPVKILTAEWLPLVVLLGILFICVFFLFALSSQKAGVAITAVSSKMSVIIPATGGFLFFGELVANFKIIGIVIALFAFYLTFKKEGRMVVDYKLMLLPLVLFLGTGTIDILMKYLEYTHPGDNLMLKLATIFLVAFIIGSTALVVKIATGKSSLQFRNVLAGLIIGLVNFMSTYTLFKSIEFFDSSLLFPVRNSGVVLLTALVGFFFFREQLSRINWAGILLAVLAIILIASA